jgi:hypothetical protein
MASFKLSSELIFEVPADAPSFLPEQLQGFRTRSRHRSPKNKVVKRLKFKAACLVNGESSLVCYAKFHCFSQLSKCINEIEESGFISPVILRLRFFE